MLYRYVFDTCVLIDYLRDDNTAVDALLVATQKAQVFVSIISLMELYLPEPDTKNLIKNNQQIQNQIKSLRQLIARFGIEIVCCSPVVQQKALGLLDKYRSPLGWNALSDSLIIATGVTRRAYLVTNDRNWFDIGAELKIKVLSPTRLIQEA